MEEELDLLTYLIPDIKIYSVIHERMKTVLRIEPESDFPVVIGTREKGARPMRFNRQGSVLKNGKECLLYPDKDTNTWEGYVTPYIFKEGDIVKAYDAEGKALIAIYSRFDNETQLHYCFHAVSGSGTIEYSEHSQVDKFRPQDGILYAKKMFSKMTAGKFEKLKENEPVR
jgi:hypothetical protein